MSDRETSQVYHCAMCGFRSIHKNDGLRMWLLWIHCFTTHQGHDVGIDEPETAKALLKDCRLYGWWDIRPLATFS